MKRDILVYFDDILESINRIFAPNCCCKLNKLGFRNFILEGIIYVKILNRG